jgi:hypothetical protein
MDRRRRFAIRGAYLELSDLPRKRRKRRLRSLPRSRVIERYYTNDVQAAALEVLSRQQICGRLTRPVGAQRAVRVFLTDGQRLLRHAAVDGARTHDDDATTAFEPARCFEDMQRSKHVHGEDRLRVAERFGVRRPPREVKEDVRPCLLYDPAQGLTIAHIGGKEPASARDRWLRHAPTVDADYRQAPLQQVLGQVRPCEATDACDERDAPSHAATSS